MSSRPVVSDNSGISDLGPQKKARPPRSAVKIGDGEWPRFSKYEIADGYIRPAPDATMRRYDLWEPPAKAYTSLTNILRQREDRDAALLTWCKEHGLLGLLLHRVERVVFPVRGDGNGGEEQAAIRRIPQGWQLEGDSNPFGPIAQPDPACVTLHGLTSTATRVESLDAWYRFFPALTEGEARADIPHPNDPHDERFWRHYAEPIADFLEAADIIATSLVTLAENNRDSPPDRRITDEGVEVGRGVGTRNSSISDYGLAIARLNACTSSIRLFANLAPDGTVAIRWRAHSLFASLALLALQDLQAGASPLKCPCGTIFTTTAWQGRWCSDQCEWRFGKRELRARQPAKRARRPRR